jgi:Mn-dependent DtxR family transcriptional regulator
MTPLEKRGNAMKKRIKCGQEVGRPHEMDELLEAIWSQREQGRNELNDIINDSALENCEPWLSALEKEQLISVSENRVELTPAGEKETEQIIRRHRLTERLFADVFATSEEVWEREACELEHQTVLVDEAVNAVCAFLGHPPTCPHGKPIPQGSCCVEFKKISSPSSFPFQRPMFPDPIGLSLSHPRALSASIVWPFWGSCPEVTFGSARKSRLTSYGSVKPTSPSTTKLFKISSSKKLLGNLSGDINKIQI